MINVTLVGCGGTLPLVSRPLTSLHLQVEQSGVLIDCGEGTQAYYRHFNRKMKSLAAILLTHRHADHVFGLPGFLVTMNQSLLDCDRYSEITIVAPADAKKLLHSLLAEVGIPRIKISYVWLDSDYTEIEFREFRVEAVKLEHSVPCYGYTVIQPHLGHLNEDAARESVVDQKLYNFVKVGHELVTNKGKMDFSWLYGNYVDDVKVCYATDTSVCPGLYKLAKNADLAVLEGMNYEKLTGYGAAWHLSYADAAEVASKSNAKKLWLTHVGPSVLNPSAGLGVAQSIFSNTIVGEPGLSMEVCFADVVEKQKEREQ